MARKTGQHPGVRLWQKKDKGTFNLQWRDPRQDRRQRNDSAETADFLEATRIAIALSGILHQPDRWDDPPNDMHPWHMRSGASSRSRTRRRLHERPSFLPACDSQRQGPRFRQESFPTMESASLTLALLNCERRWSDSCAMSRSGSRPEKRQWK